MMREYRLRLYLIARPETLVSIVRVGKLPDVLPSYVTEREIILHTRSTQALTSSNIVLRQCFIVELLIDDPIPNEYIKIREEAERTVYIASTIKKNWLEKIFVLDLPARNLAYRLLNSQTPIPITVDSRMYANSQASSSSQGTQDFSAELAPVDGRFIEIIQGDILGSGMQTLVNTINCVGVMGKGIALAFRQQYPSMFLDYQSRCRSDEGVTLGKPYLYRHAHNRWILNFPTKNHWRHHSHLKDIEAGLNYLVAHAAEWGIQSLAIPPLGCGNGGLDWEEVQPLILACVRQLNVPIEIYTPFPEPELKPPRPEKKQRRTAKDQSRLFFPPRKKHRKDSEDSEDKDDNADNPAESSSALSTKKR